MQQPDEELELCPSWHWMLKQVGRVARGREAALEKVLQRVETAQNGRK